MLTNLAVSPSADILRYSDTSLSLSIAPLGGKFEPLIRVSRDDSTTSYVNALPSFRTEKHTSVNGVKTVADRYKGNLSAIFIATSSFCFSYFHYPHSL